MRMRRLVGLIAMAWLLAGCSAIRTVYNQADHIALWRVDDYFDLDAEQKRMFRASFARLHAWHRATQLETYARMLETLDRRYERGPQLQDVTWAMEAVHEQLRPLVLKAYPDAAALLATLTDGQVAAARRELERQDRKFAREHGAGASPEEQKRLRAKRDIDTVEEWTGALDRNQRARVQALSEAQPLDADLRQQDRLRRERAFLALLAQRNDARFAERLRDWLLDWNADRPAQDQARMSEYLQARARFFLAVYGELRPEQRARVSERLRNYIAAFRDLSRNAERRVDAGATSASAQALHDAP